MNAEKQVCFLLYTQKVTLLSIIINIEQKKKIPFPGFEPTV